MSRLIAHGCSFTYGHGLPDCYIENNGNFDEPGQTPSLLSWPNILSNKLDKECVNLSECGISNRTILLDLLNFKFKESDIVFIQWTFPDRETLYSSLDKYKHIRIDTPKSKDYFKKYHTDFNSHLNLYLYSKFIKNFLLEKNIKSYHTTIVDLHYENEFKDINVFSPVEPFFNITERLDSFGVDNMHPGLAAHTDFANQIYKVYQHETKIQ